ncbi:hypothetical protein BZA77DRAFT_243894 [Pyronema omphalodes]|nr:hypothetical protein BZA77DRAFT_243894 [Pyronema omphalodes]
MDANTNSATEPFAFENDDRLQMIREPETRPISSDQLIVEVKGIYAGLIMVEAKCGEVDAKQRQEILALDTKKPPLNHEQWQALIALHRTLLHEHNDYFLASQHPSADAALIKLAQKYSMPAEMWRHRIHSFLELLLHRLPHSLGHILTLRMAIEDDGARNREAWQNCAKFWYSRAADKNPDFGRLYHHLAILARPNILHHFFFYCKSLDVVQPFQPVDPWTECPENFIPFSGVSKGGNRVQIGSTDSDNELKYHGQRGNCQQTSTTWMFTRLYNALKFNVHQVGNQSNYSGYNFSHQFFGFHFQQLCKWLSIFHGQFKNFIPPYQ